LILVAGAGAIGQLVAARLQNSGHDVQCLVRQRFVEPLHNLTIHGHTEFHGAIESVTEPNGTYDTILITAKAHQTVTAARQCLPYLASDGVMASLQNGLGNGQKLAAIVGPERSAVALTANGATFDDTGLHHAGTGTTQVGPANPEFPVTAKRIHSLLTDAGLEPTLHDDMRGPTWLKAIVNAALNPIAAMFDCTNGEVLAHPERRALCKSLALESTALAERARVQLAGDPWRIVKQVLERTASNTCSMVQDFRAKRPTEVEQITGRMVRLNERLLGHMPKSEAIYGRIKDLEATYMGAADAKQMAWDELEWEATPF
jgi:2-dehydropantoate 2-reductase